MATTTIKIEVDTSEVQKALEDITSPTIAEAVRVMLSQREKGLEKYGVSLEDSKLDPIALIEHAQEEAADLSVYLAQAKVAMANYSAVHTMIRQVCSDVAAVAFAMEQTSIGARRLRPSEAAQKLRLAIEHAQRVFP